jgi:hypothetical protein
VVVVGGCGVVLGVLGLFVWLNLDFGDA